MTDKVGENLALIVIALTDVLRLGSADALEVLLDEKVVWTGMFPDEICHNRDEVLGALLRNRPSALRISRIEAEENGDLVAISVEGPDFHGDHRLPSGAPRSLLFTFHKGHVIRIQSVKSRDEAFRLVRGMVSG